MEENEQTLSTDLLVDIVKRTLSRFVESWSSSVESISRTYHHVDVTLTRENDRTFSIRLTNYGDCEFDLACLSRYVFQELIRSTRFSCENEGPFVGTLRVKEEPNDFETLHELRLSRGRRPRLYTSSAKRRSVAFPSWKRYLSIEPKHRLISRNENEFKSAVLRVISSLQERDDRVKFTYFCDNRMIYNNHVRLDDDYKSCEVLSVALADIIKQSLNNDFRERCFATLKTDDTRQAQKIIMSKLLPTIHENYAIPKNPF